MVSHPHEFIFIKTHKTASTSVEVFLEPFCTPPSHMPCMSTDVIESEYGIVGARDKVFKDPSTRPFWRGHVGARRIRDALPEGMFARYTKVTTVRNPFDRVVSKFLFRRSYQNLPQPETLSEAIELFDAFVASDEYKSDRSRVHIKGDYVVDITLRYEHLDDDLRDLGDQLALDLSRTELPHLRNNRSARKNWQVADLFASPSSVARVLDVDRWMFERCNYSEDPRDA